MASTAGCADPPDWIDGLPPDLRSAVARLSEQPNFPLQLARLAATLRAHAASKPRPIGALALRARELAADDPQVRHLTEGAVRHRVPAWHFAIVQDDRRNATYAEALRAAITPRSTVLEVGTGSGILAMLAAQAGAAHVYTCEAEPLVAEAARVNIERNGWSDRITVIPKPSAAVEVGSDLPAKADVFVAEIVDNGLLGEGVLKTMEDVKARLVAPGAALLPACVALRGALVGGEDWARRCRMVAAGGFDLRPSIRTPHRSWGCLSTFRSMAP